MKPEDLALVDYASIIIGASEHQELCWVHFPEQVAKKIANLESYSTKCCNLVPINKFFLLTARIFFGGLHTTFSHARIHSPRT